MPGKNACATRCHDRIATGMKDLPRIASLAFMGCLLTGCNGASNADSNDLTKWQGTWKMTACTYDGEPQKGDMEWVVSGDHYNLKVDGKLGQDPYNITLDPSQKRIDVFHHDTPPGTYGGKLKGIYEIRGDSLTVCYDLT